MGRVPVIIIYLKGNSMARITKVNHVAIVVPEIDGALNFWRDGLGLMVDHIEDVPSQKSIVAFIPL
jgi:hypothetical protein